MASVPGCPRRCRSCQAVREKFGQKSGHPSRSRARTCPLCSDGGLDRADHDAGPGRRPDVAVSCAEIDAEPVRTRVDDAASDQSLKMWQQMARRSCGSPRNRAFASEAVRQIRRPMSERDCWNHAWRLRPLPDQGREILRVAMGPQPGLDDTSVFTTSTRGAFGVRRSRPRIRCSVGLVIECVLLEARLAGELQRARTPRWWLARGAPLTTGKGALTRCSARVPAESAVVARSRGTAWALRASISG